MPDPIRCELDRSQPVPTFDCEPVVVVGSREPNQSIADPYDSAGTCSAPSTPAVEHLLKVTKQELVVVPRNLDELVVDRGAHCFSELDAIAMLFAGGSGNLVLAGLAGAKAGFDLAKCIDRVGKQDHAEQVNSAKLAVEQDCADRGGAVIGWNHDTLTCEVAPSP